MVDGREVPRLGIPREESGEREDTVYLDAWTEPLTYVDEVLDKASRNDESPISRPGVVEGQLSGSWPNDESPNDESPKRASSNDD